MAATDNNQCLVCSTDCGDTVCELCEAAPYCSDQCEAADLYVIFVARLVATNEYTDKNQSMTHRQLCGFKQRPLDYQNFCVVCETQIRGSNVQPIVCNKCFGIKYCSIQCQRDNE